MKRLWVIAFFLFLNSGCNHSAELSDINTPAREYLIEQGYDILSSDGNDTYTYTEKDLKNEPDASIWAVQKEDPMKFINEEILVSSFTVKNHPLDKEFYGREPHYLQETNLQVFIYENEVIGGTSYPGSTEPLSGNVYSIDGKTQEQMRDKN